MESCAPLLEPGDRRALLFDIGGGSTEIAWIRILPGRQVPELIGYISVPSASSRCPSAAAPPASPRPASTPWWTR
jgi:hypothetical protein